MPPTVLSPASPSELLHYIVTCQLYPTTLLICCAQNDFISSLVSDVKSQVSEQDQELSDDPPHPLLATPLFQEAVARHIRILFVPTVTHLRATLSVFSPANSRIPAPPNLPSSPTKRCPPLLLVYGFLDLHRDSSEWSAQGIGSSATLLVEGARRTGFNPVIIEPKGVYTDFQALLHDDAPVLSGSLRRDEGGWTGRTVEVKRVLGRWFHFQAGQWDTRWSENSEVF